MNVRFKMTDKGEVAILPRKDYEALAAKAQEADEDFGTARLVVRARKEVAAGMPLIPKKVVTELPAAKMRCASFASGAVKRSSTSRTRPTSDRVIFPTWKTDAEGGRPQL